MRDTLPEEIRALIGNRELERLTIGRSDAQTYKVGDRYLKIAPRDSLSRSAKMQQYLSTKGFTAPVPVFVQDAEKDYVLAEGVEGIDATAYAGDKAQLCWEMGRAIRRLHDTQASDCPYPDATELLIKGYEKDEGRPFDGDTSVLERNTLIHGDCCLPNLIFRDGVFEGFIDFDCAGLGDRHIDLASILWSTHYNLKTDEYDDILLSAYGKEKIDAGKLELCTRLLGYDKI